MGKYFSSVVGAIIVGMLAVAAGGCILGPDNGYLAGKISIDFLAMWGPNRVYAFDQPLAKGTILTGGETPDRQRRFTITVDGNESYYVYTIVDSNESGKYDAGDHVDYPKGNPIYVAANETVVITFGY